MFRSFALLALATVATSFTPRVAVDRVRPNDNRHAAGTLRNGLLQVQLEARVARWHPDGDDRPGADMMAFAEVGKAPQIPGPLLRVVAGTRVTGTIRNSLPNDTMLVYGLHARGGPTGPAGSSAPLQLAPGETRQLDFQLDAPGTYLYWATTMHRAIKFRVREDAQLSGAIVVDERGAAPRPDRVFVIGMWSDTVGGAMPHGRKRILMVMNGRSWPTTERLTYTVGDTVRWRVINASGDIHPMHLHGFYFRVDSRGDGERDTTYAESERDRLVTELIEQGHTIRMRWVPERDGNWAYHCHVPEHIMARGPLGTLLPAERAHMTNHATQGMSGLVTGVYVRPRPGEASTALRGEPGRRRFRLVVQNTPNAPRTVDLHFALGDGASAPVRDSLVHMGPPIVVNVGEPVSIMVVNTSRYPTSVHWHGIELESYFDGIAGFSGTNAKLSPVIAPSDSFEARFTPPRAGTFIYHSHVDEGRQQPMGLIGGIIVLAPGQRYAPATDLLAVVSSPPDSADEARAVLFNGSLTPVPLALSVGTTYRLRVINITTARPGLKVTLRQDTSLVGWRILARDGADLDDAHRVTQLAEFPLSIGQTVDMEITPRRAGTLRLDTRANAGFSLGSLTMRVAP
jgi:FtsP/CotA-like multicopper oxidase with cupredoxin domain